MKPHSIYHLHEFKESLIHAQNFLVSFKKDSQILRMLVQENSSEAKYLQTLKIGDEVKITEERDGGNLVLLIWV